MNKRNTSLLFCFLGVLFLAALLVVLLLFILPDGKQASSDSSDDTVSSSAPTGLTVDTGTHADLHRLSGLILLRTDAVEPEILSALKEGGITVLNHAEMPSTPDTVPEYRAEALDFDADAVFRLSSEMTAVIRLKRML